MDQVNVFLKTDLINERVFKITNIKKKNKNKKQTECKNLKITKKYKRSIIFSSRKEYTYYIK